MNCANHPTEPAVAQCVNCGRGLCQKCVDGQKKPLCISCKISRYKNSVVYSMLYLLLYVVLFYIGYKWNFLSHNHSLHDAKFSGYFFITILTGYYLIQSWTHNVIVEYDSVHAIISLIIGFIFSLLIGFVAVPIVILWNLFRLFWSSLQLAKIKR